MGCVAAKSVDAPIEVCLKDFDLLVQYEEETHEDRLEGWEK